MKKVKRRLTFAAAVAGTALAAALTACHETVYGPPETVYGPPFAGEGETYDPASEIPEDVYGPPGDFRKDADDAENFSDSAATETVEEVLPDESTEVIAEPDGMDDTDQIAPALYGPPPGDD